MSDVLDQEQVSVRVNQVYRNYLNSLFWGEYYTAHHEAALKHARIFDFFIALGTLIAGGSGLGILAEPNLAWVCGLVTTIALVLSGLKTAYNWSNRIKVSSEKVAAYGGLSSEYHSLIEDINFRMAWTGDFENRFKRLREQTGKIPKSFDFGHLDTVRQRQIQNGIKDRIPYTKWWSFKA